MSNFYEIGKWYSITIAPSDKYQFVRKPDRLQKLRAKIYENLLTWKDYNIDYCIFFELSEPQNIKNGIGSRQHCHGMIRFRSNKGIYKWLLYLQANLLHIGIIDMDTIEDKKVWWDYCNKQQHIIGNKSIPISNYILEDFKTIYLK